MRLALNTRESLLGGIDHADRAFESAAELLDADGVDGAIVIDAAAWEQALATAEALRAAPHLTRMPIYLSAQPGGQQPDAAGALFDGVALAEPDWKARAVQVLSEAERFANRATAPGEALAQYLACRPQARLRPIRDWRAPGYYRYPVVEALLGAIESPFVWLDRWTQRHVLDLDVVVDRLRLCDACGSAHLSYLDVCPACGSLDILNMRLLHCFTCSHVGTRESFVHQDRLRCPKCEAVLRHIGVDYDRPIEQQQCRHCKHLFVDASVRSACMACGATSGPEHLQVRTIAIYRLGGAGLLLARQGNLSPVLSGLDIVNFIAPALFERLIDWQVALAKRYPESHFFSVIAFRVANLGELVETLGRSATGALVDAFAERLRAMLRVCDLTTRGDEHFWLLAPHTNSQGTKTLIQRVVALCDATRQGARVQLKLTSTAATIPEDTEIPTEGNQMMGVLAARLQ
jgi:GGDEF domain-containing protein